MISALKVKRSKIFCILRTNASEVIAEERNLFTGVKKKKKTKKKKKKKKK